MLSRYYSSIAGRFGYASVDKYHSAAHDIYSVAHRRVNSKVRTMDSCNLTGHGLLLPDGAQSRRPCLSCVRYIHGEKRDGDFGSLNFQGKPALKDDLYAEDHREVPPRPLQDLQASPIHPQAARISLASLHIWGGEYCTFSDACGWVAS